LATNSSTPTDQVILTAEGFLTADDFGELPEGSRVIFVPEEEAYGCNTIGLENGKVLVAEGYPTVLKEVQELGLEPIILDMSQIREADGSITCCTLFF
jgi:dimethylargininase